MDAQNELRIKCHKTFFPALFSNKRPFKHEPETSILPPTRIELEVSGGGPRSNILGLTFRFIYILVTHSL